MPWGMFRGPTVKRYDFRRPDKFSKDQLRTLQIIHESFARGMTTYLSGYVRTIVEGEVVSVAAVDVRRVRALFDEPDPFGRVQCLAAGRQRTD